MKELRFVGVAVKKSDIGDTIKAIDDKQKALLGGKTLANLATDELLQYAEPGNVKVVSAAEPVSAAMNADFASGLVDNALPVLIKAAPVVLRLLVRASGART